MREEINTFLLDEGANLENEISDSIDVLVLGEASARARKKAEALNAQGARIVVVNHLREFLKITPNQATAYVLDPATRERFLQLSKYVWLRPRKPIPFFKRNLEHLKISFNRKRNRVGLNFLAKDSQFRDCIFEGLDFSDFRIDGQEYRTFNCVFERTRLERTELQLESCSLVEVDGVDTSLKFATNCDLTKVKVSGRFGDLRVCTLTDVTFDQGNRTHSEARLSQCRVKGMSLHVGSCFLYGTTAERLEVKDATGKLSFESAEINGAVLRNCNCDSIVFNKSKISNLKFENCSFKMIEVDSSTIFSDCSSVNSRFDLADRAVEQLATFGASANARVPSLKDCPAYVELVQVINETTRMKFDLDIQTREDSLLHLHFYCSRARAIWYCSVAECGSYTEGGYSLEKSNFLKALADFTCRGKLIAPLEASVRLSSSKCPLKPTVFKKLVGKALTQVFNQVNFSGGTGSFEVSR